MLKRLLIRYHIFALGASRPVALLRALLTCKLDFSQVCLQVVSNVKLNRRRVSDRPVSACNFWSSSPAKVTQNLTWSELFRLTWQYSIWNPPSGRTNILYSQWKSQQLLLDSSFRNLSPYNHIPLTFTDLKLLDVILDDTYLVLSICKEHFYK